MGKRRSWRSVGTAAYRASRRYSRELERQQRYLEKQQELLMAEREVERYEDRLERLASHHVACAASWDWRTISESKAPAKPTQPRTREQAARARLERYRPGPLTRLLRLEALERRELATAVKQAKAADEAEYQSALGAYKAELGAWERATALARGVLAGDPQAYIEAIEYACPFILVHEIGLAVECRAASASVVEATLWANTQAVVPSEVKTLLKSGRLSVKDMPKTRFHELYQGHVCSCVLRVAREVFAVLPVKLVIVTVLSDLLNTSTGHVAATPILSVAIPRATLNRLNFDRLDPSDALANFVHRMKFRKPSGFGPVERLGVGEVTV